MNFAKLVSVAALSIAGLLSAQQTDLSNKPSVVVENKEKPKKDAVFRLIRGIVNDPADNPVPGAIVQLKNTKSSRVVSFATKDDGKYAFRDLKMDVDYELLVKRGNVTTAVKKVSIYDTRKEVTINFKLESPKQP